MNKKVKQKWIKALRSGKYKQGRGYLRYNDKYCCLGVIIKLYIEEHSDEKWEKIPKRNFFSFKGDHYNLPKEVQDWAETSNDPPVVIKGINYTLTTMNDGNATGNIKPHTFDQIADLIEKQL